MSHSQPQLGPRALATFLILLAVLILVALAAPLALAAPGPDPMALEGPVAAAYDVRPAGGLAAVATTPLDIAAARAEDEDRDAAGLPARFAIPEAAWLTPEDGGTWETLDEDHLIWRARVTVPGALSINLGFTGYRLPPGARLSLYPADTKGPDDIRGLAVFTAEDNEDHGELWTPVILADDIVVELVLPVAERRNYRLELTSINKGYRYFGEEVAAAAFDKQGACNIDVVCPEGGAWQDEIHSVAAYSTGGSIFCTGSMLNNTAQDGTPYFLTADHCGMNAGNDASMVVYWNFQSVNCGDLGGGSLADFQTGATFLAGSSTSDFTLLVLDDPVDPAHEVSFAGWNNATMDFAGAVAIHHPNGDEKAISFENDPTTTTDYLGTTVPGDGTHIRVTDWDLGTTEPGSSGSPLFDPDHRVVGQLHGGYAACGNDDSDWYGRLSVSWPSIVAYLDPLGTGQATLDTWSPWLTGLLVDDGTGLAGTGDIGGPFSPADKVYTLTNMGETAFDFSISADVPWVSVSTTGGTLAAGASTTVTVSFNAAANMLGPGRYEGTVNFINLTTGDGDTVRAASLEVGFLPVHAWDLATDPGWTTEGAWAWGVPQGLGGVEHGNADPSAGYTGANVLGYNLAGDYTSDLPETHLTTTAIDCTGLVETTLRFRRWLNVEQPRYDQASLSISTDGVTFTPLWSNPSEITENSWSLQEFDISAVADGRNTVYLRWTMGPTDGSWEFAGWNLDDIAIWAYQPDPSPAPDTPRFVLGVDNYPNPFNPLTRINFTIERAGHASVRVYDLQGRMVRTLLDGVRPEGPGQVVWDGTDATGRKVASGVYFARVLSGGKGAEHKMVLLK